MSSKELAFITPTLISWAIDRSGLTYSQIEKSLNSTEKEIDSWITGEQFPTLNKAIKLAKILRIPFGYFFMEKPPKLEVPLPDFRTLKTSQTRTLSLDFLDSLYASITQQKWYRQFLLEQGAEPLSFVGKFTINDDENIVASDIRSTILMYDARYRATRWKEYFTNLSKNAESAGILVMRNGVVGNDNTRPLSVKEFQGFAITDLIAPLVFINNNDTDAPKVFTLVHELAHIWIGKSAISNPEEVLTDDAIPIIETFCNKVATEALVPKDEFLSNWKPYGGFEQVEKLARHFFVSTLVIIRRARELELITPSEFGAFYQTAKSKVQPKKTSKSDGGNYFATVEARHSKIFNAVIRDIKRGRTTYRDGARLVSMHVPTLVNYMEGKNQP